MEVTGKRSVECIIKFNNEEEIEYLKEILRRNVSIPPIVYPGEHFAAVVKRQRLIDFMERLLSGIVRAN